MAREGYTIQELEDMWRDHVVEIGVGAIFALSAICALIWGGMMLLWSVLLCMGLGIVGVVFPDHVRKVTTKVFGFLGTKDTVPMVVALSIGGIISIFAPCLIFAAVGLAAGSTIHYDAYNRAIPTAVRKMEPPKKSDDEQRKAS